MTRALLWMLRLVTHNFGWKLLAVGASFLLWVVVASEPELATFATVPVQYRNLPDDLEISSDLIESVYLELRGPSGELASLSDVRRPAVVLDMTGIVAGERTFAIGPGNVRLPRGVRLIRAIPPQVRFTFERRTSRSVPVRVRFDTNSEREYEVAAYEVSPSQVTIVGPESHVARVTAATTDTIDLSGVVGRSEFRVNAFVEDGFVRFQSPPTVTVAVTMKKK